MSEHDLLRRCAELLDAHGPVLALTGAGCSVDSGIACYRDDAGTWTGLAPVTFQSFLARERARQRYWGRSLVGWRAFAAARPGATHHALAALETAGRSNGLITQNVDRLHHLAGSRAVIELHGRLDRVRCLECGEFESRADLQRRLEELNPARAAAPPPRSEPDPGDVRVPDCLSCGGRLKPDVVFFGEQVPRERVEAAHAALAASGSLLIVGSSLAAWSGLRFCHAARDQGKPVVAVNLGRTRADPLLSLKLDLPCGPTLTELARLLGA